MILKSEYFVGPVNITGLHDDSPSSENIKETLDYYINIYEPQYLEMVLGPALCPLFMDSLNGNSTEERWIKLRDLLAKECSPLAMFVFFYYVRGRQSSATPTGVKSDTEVSAYGICRNTWNSAVFFNKKVYSLLSNGEYEGFEFDNSLITMIW